MFQTVQFSVSTVLFMQSLNIKTVLFQTFQFSISTQFLVYTQLNGKTVNFKQVSLA